MSEEKHPGERSEERHAQRDEAIEALQRIPVPPPAWQSTPAEVVARGRKRHRRVQTARAGAGILSLFAVVALANSGIASGGGDDIEVVPAAPSAVVSASPTPGGTDEPGPDGTASPSAPARPSVRDTAPATTEKAEEAEPVLADGVHTVFITMADVDGRDLTFDVVQFLTGEAAGDAWKAQYPDDEYGYPPNDFMIVNENMRLRTLPVAKGVKVTLVHLATDSNAESEPGTFEELPVYLKDSGGQARMRDGERSGSPYDIAVIDGVIVRIDERYIP